MNWITAPWPWFVAGPLITLVMIFLILAGRKFGVSSTLRTVCSVGGAGKYSDYFRFEWKETVWNLFFVAGAIIGGYIANTYMLPEQAIALNPSTIQSLQAVGISDPGSSYLPDTIFSWENLLTLQGFVFMVFGGFLVGFGTRYAEGCTSGHAISGLSDLQWPSFVAVLGFFIGGLFVTHFIFPYIL